MVTQASTNPRAKGHGHKKTVTTSIPLFRIFGVQILRWVYIGLGNFSRLLRLWTRVFELGVHTGLVGRLCTLVLGLMVVMV